jgi:sec-independent protein translocase protein TatA
MPHIGFSELVIIMVVVLLLFGAKRIPEIAGSMGKGIKEFKKHMNEAERELGVGSTYQAPRLTNDELNRPVRDDVEQPEPKRLLS